MGPLGRALARSGAESGLDLDTITFLDIWNRFVKDNNIVEVEGPQGDTDFNGMKYKRIHCVFGGKNPELSDDEKPDLILVNYTPDTRMMSFCNSLIDWLGDRKLIVWREYPKPIFWTEKKGNTTINCSQVIARLSAYRLEELGQGGVMQASRPMWETCNMCGQKIWNCSCAYFLRPHEDPALKTNA